MLSCEHPYVANNNAKFLLKPVEDLGATELGCHYGKNGIKLLAGCAPCQTFSTYNQKATETDKRWLFWVAKELGVALIDVVENRQYWMT